MTQTGVIKFYDDRKGYGFIIPDDKREDIFVHASDVDRGLNLDQGMRVQFISGHSRDGRLCAKHVKMDHGAR